MTPSDLNLPWESQNSQNASRSGTRVHYTGNRLVSVCTRDHYCKFALFADVEVLLLQLLVLTHFHLQDTDLMRYPCVLTFRNLLTFIRGSRVAIVSPLLRHSTSIIIVGYWFPETLSIRFCSQMPCRAMPLI